MATENPENISNNEEENNNKSLSANASQANANTENEEQQSADTDKKALIESALVLLRYVRSYLNRVLNLREGAEIEETIAGIKRNIDFRGHRAWILVCSIILASIGLNTNSTAVVIGAMLISPLMGPILGVGLAVGTNDFKTLTYSARSFGTMVLLSLVTSTLYFLISPIDEPQSELMARTRPTILDAGIAIFGGLAGIIAGSNKEKSTVIPGVAIATALMPPLCTAGFGLANLKWDFFFGAFYLFLLNSIFIALATFVIVKFLRFPVVQFINKQREKTFNTYMIVLTVVVLIPSGWLFIDVIKESYFNTRAVRFISENFMYEKSEIINQKISYSGKENRIDIYVLGEPIEENEIERLSSRMPTYGLENVTLRVHQAGTSEMQMGKLSQEVRSGIIEDLYKRNEELLREKDSTIQILSSRINQIEGDSIPYTSLKDELQVQYPMLRAFSFARVIESSFDGSVDTIPTVFLKWSVSQNSEFTSQRAKEQRIQNWLRIRLKEPNLVVVSH